MSGEPNDSGEDGEDAATVWNSLTPAWADIGDDAALPFVVELGVTDTTAPTTTLSGADAKWHRSAVTLTLSASDNSGGSGVKRTEYKIGSGSWTTLADSTLVIAAPANHSNDGSHAVSYRSINNANNTESTRSCTVKIDTSKPTTRAPHAASVVRGRTATLKYKVVDASPNGGTARVTIRVKTLTGKVAKTLNLSVKPVNKLLSAKFRCTLAKRTYKFFVCAKDTAGNTQAKAGSNKLVVRSGDVFVAAVSLSRAGLHREPESGRLPQGRGRVPRTQERVDRP